MTKKEYGTVEYFMDKTNEELFEEVIDLVKTADRKIKSLQRNWLFTHYSQEIERAVVNVPNIDSSVSVEIGLVAMALESKAKSLRKIEEYINNDIKAFRKLNDIK